MEIKLEKIERYKGVLSDYITNNEPIGVLEAVGILNALKELSDYKRLGSIEEFCETLEKLV